MPDAIYPETSFLMSLGFVGREVYRRVGEPKFRVIKCIRWPDRVDAIYVTLYNVVHNSTQSVRAGWFPASEIWCRS